MAIHKGLTPHAPAAPAAAVQPDTMLIAVGRFVVLFSFVVIVSIRLLTETFPVLPVALNYVDIALLGLLGLLALLSPRDRVARVERLSLLALAFLVVWTLSALLNLSRVHPLPAIVFLHTFLAPILFYACAARLWSAGRARTASRLVIGLAVLQFVVVIGHDLPRFWSDRNPDFISGTFGENPYQLVFFLQVFSALMAGIFAYERKRFAARMALPLILASVVIAILAQFRALLVTMVLALLLTWAIIISGRSIGRLRTRRVFVGVFMSAVFVVGFMLINTYFPRHRLARSIEVIRHHPGAVFAGKYTGAQDAMSMFRDNPRLVLTGSGPGTYSSRAWKTFSIVGTKEDESGAVLGLTRYSTDVSDRYVLPRWYESQAIFESNVLRLPFSSYIALFAEVGLPGLAIMIGMYVFALVHFGRMTLNSIRRRTEDDPLPALLLAGTIGLFVLLQMALIDNWLEVTRVTVPTWLLLGIATKEHRLRHGSSAAGTTPG